HGLHLCIAILDGLEKEAEKLIGNVLGAGLIGCALVAGCEFAKNSCIPSGRILEDHALRESVGSRGVVVLQAFDELLAKLFEAGGGVREGDVEDFGGVLR